MPDLDTMTLPYILTRIIGNAVDHHTVDQEKKMLVVVGRGIEEREVATVAMQMQKRIGQMGMTIAMKEHQQTSQ